MAINIFKKLFGNVKSFGAFLEKTLITIQQKEPQLATIATGVLKYAGSALQIALAASGNAPAAALIGQVVNEGTNDLAVATSLVYDFGPNPSALSLYQSVKDNLKNLLAAGHVTDPKAVDAVNKTINEIEGIVTVLEPLVETVVKSLPADAPVPAPALPEVHRVPLIPPAVA